MPVPSPARPARPVLHLVKPGGAEETAALDFDTLFRRYSGYVATIGYRLLGRDSEIDDLVQEVFLAAHRGLIGLRDPGAVRRWLATVCVRYATRRLRARRLRIFLSLDALADVEDPSCTAASPEAAAELVRVYRKMNRLPAAQRVAWVLRHVEGESLDEIALICRCSKSTVQRRVRAAQTRLDQEMAR